MPTKREKDSFSGIETTGHEWDGIRELDNPLPRWWLWVLYATIAFALLWWVLYPAWPLLDRYSEGLIGTTNRDRLAVEMAAARERQGSYLARLTDASTEEIMADPDLRAFAIAAGRSAFAVNCSQCHGAGAQGAMGYPNLNDDDWLWGGTPGSIETTIRHGIRSPGDDATRISDMPRFGADELLTDGEIEDVAHFVLSLSQAEHDAAAAERGAVLFADNCSYCHGESGEGMAELGAPRLNDPLWLYGGSFERVVETIYYARAGVMPAWEGRLDDATIKSLAVYIHALGGGE